MASAPFDQDPVIGRVDREGRLTAADPALLRLQQEAGSNLGAPLALPQLASVVRSAMKLGVPLSRPVIAASADQDLDLWVRAEPDEGGATLTIEGWKARPPAPPRLTLVGNEPSQGADDRPDSFGLSTDAELRISAIDEGLAARLGIEAGEAPGQPLTRHFVLLDDGDGMMPLLVALGGRQDFEGQQARPRGGESDESVLLAGTAVLGDTGKFAGFRIAVDFRESASTAPGMFDPALDEALRSPLDRIIAAADRIVDRSEGPLRSDYAAYAGDIAAAGRHLLSVIHSMTQQEEESESRGVDLARSALEAVQLVQARGVEQGIGIEVVGADQPLLGEGDPRGTVQILVNILGNAVRHSPQNGTIAVILERREDQVAVTVADEGPGIAPADQERIFERYEQVGGTPGETGLGLAISRRLARSMGGDVALVSTPGEGARFTLILPAA